MASHIGLLGLFGSFEELVFPAYSAMEQIHLQPLDNNDQQPIPGQYPYRLGPWMTSYSLAHRRRLPVSSGQTPTAQWICASLWPGRCFTSDVCACFSLSRASVHPWTWPADDGVSGGCLESVDPFIPQITFNIHNCLTQHRHKRCRNCPLAHCKTLQAPSMNSAFFKTDYKDSTLLLPELVRTRAGRPSGKIKRKCTNIFLEHTTFSYYKTSALVRGDGTALVEEGDTVGPSLPQPTISQQP